MSTLRDQAVQVSCCRHGKSGFFQDALTDTCYFVRAAKSEAPYAMDRLAISHLLLLQPCVQSIPGRENMLCHLYLSSTDRFVYSQDREDGSDGLLI